ncbi:hypothetical protein ACMCNP_06755 [Candidatus Acidulodesulfobacterium sp. H_13]|uniref:hypothetical protein n=1 Tax=Candidatus Acidulodesulfobacterium sp. H_13 TaxID=3395470 RepID=UPI003AF63BA7
MTNKESQTVEYKQIWHNEHLAVKYIKEDKIITLSSYKTLIKNISEKTLYRDLQDLINKNILKEIGEKRGRKYELV